MQLWRLLKYSGFEPPFIYVGEQGMNTKIEKNALVKLVGALIVALVLLGVPMSAQAAPIQGSDVVTPTDAGALGWLAGLGQAWDHLLSTLGLASGGGERSPADATGFGTSDSTTKEQTLLENPIVEQPEARTRIEVAG